MTINFKTKSGYDLPSFPMDDIYMIANDSDSDEWHVTVRITSGMGRAMQNEMWQIPYNSVVDPLVTVSTEDVDRNP